MRGGTRAAAVALLACCSLAGAALEAQGTAAGSSSSSSSAQPASGTTSRRQPAPEASSAKLATAAPVTYDNRYELFAGLNFMNFQAGQNLPRRMNLGGVEVMGTYWLNGRLGVAADFRGDAGTTPVLANPYTNRPLVVLYTGMGGVQYRSKKTQRAALDFHALAGVSHGDFTQTPLPAGYDVGLYSNRTSPIAALGASVDFNRTKNLAIRLSPDLILEHFGTETREFFAISGGIVYRLGKR